MRSFPFSIDGGDNPLTLARLVKITRRDGTVYRFTSNAADIIDGNGDTWIAEPAITISDIAFRNDATPASLTIQVATNDIITDADVAQRRFSDARAQALLIDYSSPSLGSASLLNGVIADISTNRYGVIVIEVRSRLTLGRAILTEVYQPMDRAQLGDLRNKVPILPDDVARNTAYAEGDTVRARVTTTGTPADYANVYYQVILGGSGTTALVAPAYDATPAALIVDGSVTFTPFNAWLRYAQVDAVIDSFRFTLTFLPDPAASDNTWYPLGEVIIRSGIFDGTAFEIGAWDSSTLTVSTLDSISSFLVGGEWLEIIPGYDRRLETTRDKFNDVLNFRGERVTAGRDPGEFALVPGDGIAGTRPFPDGESNMNFISTAQPTP